MTAIAASTPAAAPRATFAMHGLDPIERLLPCACPAARAGKLRSGNPRGNPFLATCGGATARTTGHACRTPVIPNGSCRQRQAERARAHAETAALAPWKLATARAWIARRRTLRRDQLAKSENFRQDLIECPPLCGRSAAFAATSLPCRRPAGQNPLHQNAAPAASRPWRRPCQDPKHQNAVPAPRRARHNPMHQITQPPRAPPAWPHRPSHRWRRQRTFMQQTAPTPRTVATHGRTRCVHL